MTQCLHSSYFCLWPLCLVSLCVFQGCAYVCHFFTAHLRSTYSAYLFSLSVFIAACPLVPALSLPLIFSISMFLLFCHILLSLYIGILWYTSIIFWLPFVYSFFFFSPCLSTPSVFLLLLNCPPFCSFFPVPSIFPSLCVQISLHFLLLVSVCRCRGWGGGWASLPLPKFSGEVQVPRPLHLSFSAWGWTLLLWRGVLWPPLIQPWVDTLGLAPFRAGRCF